MLEARGAGKAFSLNCGPDTINAAQRSRRGFAGYLHHRIRDLRKALGFDPLCAFAVDVEGGRLHIHGAIEANENTLDVIRAALCNAGGTWASPHHGAKQCDFDFLDPPDGWAVYCLRHRGKVRRLIEGSQISISNNLRRLAKARYRGDRRRLFSAVA